MKATEYNARAYQYLWDDSDLAEMWNAELLLNTAPQSSLFVTHVQDLQKMFGLYPDGKLGPTTMKWAKYGMFGVDVSRYSGDAFPDDPAAIDWNQVESAGYEFAIIKATEGVGYPRKHVEALVEGVWETKLELNYYHFGTPHYILRGVSAEEDGRAEAKEFCSVLRDLNRPPNLELMHGSGQLWLDLEKDAPKLNPVDMVDWVRAFVKGCYPWKVGLYSSSAWLEEEVGEENLEGIQLMLMQLDHPLLLWLARYGKNDGNVPYRGLYSPEAKIPELWRSIYPDGPSIWQFTSKGVVPGIEEVCDLNLALSSRPYSERHNR